MNRPARRRFLLHPLAWVGLAVVTLGTGPLVAILLAAKAGWTVDPNPNPIGPGILAFLSFWPGIGLFVIGLVLTFLPQRVERPPPPAVGNGRPTPPTRPAE